MFHWAMILASFLLSAAVVRLLIRRGIRGILAHLLAALVISLVMKGVEILINSL